MSGRVKEKTAAVHANGVWGGSGGSGSGGQREATAVGSQRRRPTQQMLTQVGEEETMGAGPAGGGEHGECALGESRCGNGGGQSGQRGAERPGLRPKTAQPELAALVRHRRRCGCGRRGRDETDHEPPGDEREAGAEVRQCELREQGNGAAAGFTQITAHADRSVKSSVDDGAGVEAVRGEWIFGLTLRAAGGTMLVRIVELGEVLLHRTGEWV